MYKECLKCEKLGVSCDGPNFVAMPAPQLLEWCKLRKAQRGLSNAKLAELSGVPKGTIDRLLAGEHADFKYESIRPVIRALVGGQWAGNPCPDPNQVTDAHLLEAVEQQRKTIRQLHKDKQDMLETMTAERQSAQEDIKFLREQVHAKNRVILILAILAGVCLAVIIGALIVDRLNPDVGFFWRTILGGLRGSPGGL